MRNGRGRADSASHGHCPGESAQALESDSGSNSQSSEAWATYLSSLGLRLLLSQSPSVQGDWEAQVGSTSPTLNTDLAPG